jgi:predicted ATPase
MELFWAYSADFSPRRGDSGPLVYRHLIEDGKVFDEAGEFRTDIKIDEIDVPENVRLIISRRLERLSENEKRALAVAAAIGRSFSFELLTAISQIDVDDLFNVVEKAQRMGIIVPSSEGPEKPITFSHELVRQTLLAGTAAPRRQYLHAGVAAAFERLYPGALNEHAGEIADHLLKAGSFADRQRVVRWLRLAGKSAPKVAELKTPGFGCFTPMRDRTGLAARWKTLGLKTELEHSV